MASITITVQSLLNAALYDSYTLDDSSTVGDLMDLIQTDTGVNSDWYILSYNDVLLDVPVATLASYSIVNGSALRSGNIIANLATLQARQLAKLNLAALDRTYVSNPYNTYNIDLLPSQYIGNTSTPNDHPDGLIQGRPWVITSGPTPTLFLNANDANSYPGTGNVWHDLSGSSNDITLFNNPTYGSTPGTLIFDSANSQYGEGNTLSDLNQWTVEAWFNTSADLSAAGSNGLTTIATTTYDDGAGHFYGQINYCLTNYDGAQASNAIRVGFFNGAWQLVPQTLVPTIGQWYHVVGTYDGTTLKQYNNGALAANATIGSTSSANGGTLRIGRRWDGDSSSQYFFPGDISLVRIYNSALTATEVSQNFVETAPTYLPSVSFDFSVFGTPPYIPGNQIEDSTGSFNPTTGFTINDGAAGTGVAFISLTNSQNTFLQNSSYNNGYVWTVAWGPGSTYATTPVAVYYNPGNPGTLIYWILDPSDLTYSTPVPSGTFNFPALFIEGTTPTTFSN
jgi:hypothetical protein